MKSVFVSWIGLVVVGLLLQVLLQLLLPALQLAGHKILIREWKLLGGQNARRRA